jgi:hypothetical protein
VPRARCGSSAPRECHGSDHVDIDLDLDVNVNNTWNIDNDVALSPRDNSSRKSRHRGSSMSAALDERLVDR